MKTFVVHKFKNLNHSNLITISIEQRRRPTIMSAMDTSGFEVIDLTEECVEEKTHCPPEKTLTGKKRKRRLDADDMVETMITSAPKRLKTESESDSCDDQPVEDRGWTPFDTLDNWDNNILIIINDYLCDVSSDSESDWDSESEEYERYTDYCYAYHRKHRCLEETHHHWFVALGLSTNYTRAFKSALLQNNSRSMKYLIHKEAFIRLVDAIRYATRKGYLDALQCLFSHFSGLPGWIIMAFEYAVCDGHLDIVRYLAPMITNPTVIDRAVVRASQNVNNEDRVDIVQYLVERGADVTTNNNSAFYFAAGYGHIKMLKYLVSVGGGLRKTHEDIVRIAASQGQIHVLKYLGSQGFDVSEHLKDPQVLHMARSRGLLQD